MSVAWSLSARALLEFFYVELECQNWRKTKVILDFLLLLNRTLATVSETQLRCNMWRIIVWMFICSNCTKLSPVDMRLFTTVFIKGMLRNSGNWSNGAVTFFVIPVKIVALKILLMFYAILEQIDHSSKFFDGHFESQFMSKAKWWQLKPILWYIWKEETSDGLMLVHNVCTQV